MGDCEPVTKAEWEPKEDLLRQLIEMGISKESAEEALQCTGNTSVELAATYVFDNQSFADPASNTHSASRVTVSNEGYKMVFVVNTELNMSIGKIAAQVGHATLGLFQILTSSEKYSEVLFLWESTGEKMVTLKGRDADHLSELVERAEKLDLPTYLTTDSGLTEIVEGSTTVLALFGQESSVNRVTGDLELL